MRVSETCVSSLHGGGVVPFHFLCYAKRMFVSTSTSLHTHSHTHKPSYHKKKLYSVQKKKKFSLFGFFGKGKKVVFQGHFVTNM